MSQDQKFQQLWEFRRKDDDIDSSSNDSKLSSSSEPALKNHNLPSNLILLEDDENSDTPRPQENGLLGLGNGAHFEFAKAKKNHIGSSKKRNGVTCKTKKKSTKADNKKRKQSPEPDSMDDLKIFMESVLDELKVARENMFAQMREEMKTLVTVKSASKPRIKERKRVQKTGLVQSQKSIKSGMKTKNCTGAPLNRPVKRNSTSDSNHCQKILDDQVSHDQVIENITSNEKDEGDGMRLSAKKPIYSFHRSDQLVSSSYLTLPSVLSEAQVETQRNESSLRNYNQPGASGNSTRKNPESLNVLMDANSHHRYLPGSQPEERFGSFAQIGSKNMGYFDETGTQTSSMGTGLHVPLDQELENSFNIPSRVILGNSSRGNNIFSLRTNVGSTRISGASQDLPDHFITNNLHRHTNYKPEGFGIKAFEARDCKDGHFHPN